jgi:hypothetical protein
MQTLKFASADFGIKMSSKVMESITCNQPMKSLVGFGTIRNLSLQIHTVGSGMKEDQKDKRQRNDCCFIN